MAHFTTPPPILPLKDKILKLYLSPTVFNSRSFNEGYSFFSEGGHPARYQSPPGGGRFFESIA